LLGQTLTLCYFFYFFAIAVIVPFIERLVFKYTIDA
jgi:hypothetical protein